MTTKHSNIILLGIIAGLVLAAIVLALGKAVLPENVFLVVLDIGNFFGQFFLTALKMVIAPLIVASVIAGVTSLGDVRRIGGVGTRTVGYYAMTTALSVTLGLILVTVLQPGVGMDMPAMEEMAQSQIVETAKGKQDLAISDLLLSFLHPNIFAAMADPSNGSLLPVIVFSLLFGGIMTTIGEKGKQLISFFNAFNDVMLKLVGLIMWLAPIGVFGLVVAKFGEAMLQEGGLWSMLQGVGKYSFVVLLGLGLHFLVTLPAVCWVLARRNPYKYLADMMPAVLTAWSTASSSSTLPVTMESAEDRGKVQPRATGFVLPLGATINMDGTALYEGIAVVFIAQALGVDLSFGQLLLIFITATIASIGAAGIPQAGLVMMVIVLNIVNLPIEGIALIFAVDWFLDRFRTATNVWGDSIGAAYLSQYLECSESCEPDPA